MILSDKGIAAKSEWEAKGYKLPSYDRAQMIAETKKNPTWVHFGAGNIFRAFQANVAERLIEAGIMNTGIAVCEGFDYEIIEKAYRPSDNLSVLVTLKSDGKVEKTVIGSIAESCILDDANEAEFKRLKEIFEAGSLKMATFTITEKGYSIPAKCEESSYMGKVVKLLYARYLAGKLPIAMVSTDNCSHNGDKLKAAVLAFAKSFVENGVCEAGFVDYLNDEKKVSFPWSMIDKITPRPDDNVKAMLAADGLEGLEPIVTSKNTYVAPFVNAEETEYLVIEDAFPNGKLPLDKAGIIYTNKETVDRVEKMKVCTCLNPLHTALAVFGCILGFNKISDEVRDADLKAMIERIGYVEGLPVVTDPGVMSPKEFIDTVVGVRLPNPFMPDTPQRIATDTSQKLSIRFGETVKKYVEEGKDLNSLVVIPLVFAGWLRYLQGIDDNGNEFTPSPDPRFDECSKLVREGKAAMLLTDESIFGVNLEKVGLAERVLDLYAELCNGKGAVRSTLHKYVNK